MMKSSNQVRIQQAFTQQAPRPLAGKTSDFTIELKTIVKIYDRIYARLRTEDFIRMADVSTSEQCSQEINRKNLRLISQSVKEPLLSASESRGSSVSCWEMNKKEGEIGVLPTPLGQFFQIHGSIFKPDPSCDCGQASVVCITHCVFLFCIRKDTLNGLFALCINSFAQLRLADALHLQKA